MRFQAVAVQHGACCNQVFRETLTGDDGEGHEPVDRASSLENTNPRVVSLEYVLRLLLSALFRCFFIYSAGSHHGVLTIIDG